MNTIVLVKQVPDTTEVKLDPKTGSLLREGVKSVMNPDDRHAFEAAIRLKESHGGKVIALSMGPSQAVDVISEALGMGADQGILLSDRAFAGADSYATSFTLGKAIAKIGEFDLIMCGRQAIDGDTAQIGPQVAEYLKIPQVTCVYAIDAVEAGAIVVRKRVEDGFERVQASLPALVTVLGEMNPRYPRVSGLIEACSERAPIEVWNGADIGIKTREVGWEGSLTHVMKTFAPKAKRQGEMLEGDTRTVARALIAKLAENLLIPHKEVSDECLG
ncbi:MAG: electron transfer flavoprotein subunit beta/FixA family protein [Syntrophobacteraceae bacterium]